MSLYRDAQWFPRTLRGRSAVVRTPDLAENGITPNAAWWRANHAGVDRALRGVYLVGPTPPDLLDNARAALAVAAPTAVVGFHTAAALMGFGVVASDRVHLVVPAGGRFPQRRGIRAHQSVVPVGEPMVVRGVPCTSPARTAIDLARFLPRRDALAVLDAALAGGACDLNELVAEYVLHSGLRGIVQATDLVARADGRSQCAQETHLRLILHDAGLVEFVPQVEVLTGDGWSSYFIDLADAQLRVGVEYDGVSHLDRARMRHDRQRHNHLEGTGWTMRYFTDVDIYKRPSHVVRTVRAAQRAQHAAPRLRASAPRLRASAPRESI